MKETIGKRAAFNTYWDKYSTLFILLLMTLMFGVLEPAAFFTGSNLIKITEQSSITILLACGEFFAILLAGIDLSVGSMMAFTGVFTAKLINLGVHPVLAVVLGIFVMGGLLGFLNGLLISVTDLPPFIITLGTMVIIRGFTMVVSGARTVSGLPASITGVVGGKVGGVIPVPILIALLVGLLLLFFTRKTQAGRNLYAIGGSPSAAWFAGIHVKKHTMLAFTITGICAGVAGLVNISRLGAAEPSAGTGYETYAIAAVIIGGTSFFGGQGAIFKVVLGGLVIGLINNGLNMVGLSSYYQQIAMGALIIIAVTLDRFFGVKNK